MKGIILAGGHGTRLSPLTKVTNKVLLPIGKVPLIYHLLDIFKLANITEVMIVTNTEHVGHVISLLGSGNSLGFDFTYKIQDKADGIAAALGLCKDFIKNEKFAVLLGDNIFSNKKEIAKEIIKFEEENISYKLFLKEVEHPERFGVPVLEDGKITSIIEKPKNPPSNYAVLGLYLYTSAAFEVIKGLAPSARGEYEISDVNLYYVKNTLGSYHIINCEWFDAGNFDSYFKANEIMKDK